MNENDKTKISDLFSSSLNQDVYASTATPPQSQPPANASMGEDLSNPFASDMKTDMAGSQMSMDMSGFSQFFENQSDSSKKLALGLGVVVIVGFLAYMLIPSDSEESAPEDNFYSETDSYDGDDDEDKGESEDAVTDDMASEDGSDTSDTLADEGGYETGDEGDGDSYETTSGDSMGESMTGSGALRLLTPMDGQARSYDETAEYALFEWEGSSSVTVVFSRNANMMPEEKRVRASGNAYRLAHPWPGTWYWQVHGDDGDMSEVSRFVVDAPIRRQIAMSPLVSPLSGNGGVVSWTGDTKVARYTVELSQSGWANPAMRYQTSGTSITLSNVISGQYQIRVGAFSEVSGRWEYTPPVSVAIE